MTNKHPTLWAQFEGGKLVNVKTRVLDLRCSPSEAVEYAPRAAEQAKPDVVACGKLYGNLSLRCRRPAKHRGKCSASDGVELVAVQLAEARAGVKHLMELERQGENIEGLHSIVLRADAHQADSSGSAAGGKGGSALRDTNPEPQQPSTRELIATVRHYRYISEPDKFDDEEFEQALSELEKRIGGE